MLEGEAYEERRRRREEARMRRRRAAERRRPAALGIALLPALCGSWAAASPSSTPREPVRG
jgi:hypothetical protein